MWLNPVKKANLIKKVAKIIADNAPNIFKKRRSKIA